MNDVQIAKGMALPATLPFPTRQPALLLPGTSYWGEMDKTSGRGSPLNGHLQEQNNNSDMPLIIHSPALRAKDPNGTGNSKHSRKSHLQLSASLLR